MKNRRSAGWDQETLKSQAHTVSKEALSELDAISSRLRFGRERERGGKISLPKSD